MKKILSMLLLIMTFSIFTGCNTLSNKGSKIIYKELSEKEESILNLTGDKIAMYEIKNIPKGKSFKVSIIYEVYEKDVKIKEEVIAGIATGGPTDKEENIDIGINIKDDKIVSNINMGGAMTSNELKTDLNLRKVSHSFFRDNKELRLGDEIYIFHGVEGSTFSPIDLGLNIDEDSVKEIFKRHEENYLIKISFKEITE